MRMPVFVLLCMSCAFDEPNPRLDETTAEWEQRTAAISGPHEFGFYDVPQKLSIVREFDTAYWAWRTNRYNQYAGDSYLMKMQPGAGLATAKNPEGVVQHDPANLQNNTYNYWPGATQWLAFRFRTQNYFGPAVGDHLAFLLRAKFPTLNALGNEAYDGIGLAMHRDWPDGPAVRGERFQLPHVTPAPHLEEPHVPFPFQDNRTYLVEIHAQTTHIGYRVQDVDNPGITTGWRTWYQPSGYPPLDGTGVGFAVLCNNNCDSHYSNIRVDLWDIGSGWF